ncbi:hypothetical protein H5410_063441 [Solanum commersonii]|uniref:Uncharacterized protein n=1 Tax=Solanum commersonii TaxID=4109 RepID=A0A9J5WD90_SOLCO|nr:hypothetical protein H5410_063441 [Solanum commersonii]
MYYKPLRSYNIVRCLDFVEIFSSLQQRAAAGGEVLLVGFHCFYTGLVADSGFEVYVIVYQFEQKLVDSREPVRLVLELIQSFFSIIV